ncbi:hypothetical protein FACS189468_0390 [Spirochaetia bacterium]|nr:hypothetical protein FACS189468_0390 [Spirochaetia bacterium]
MFEKARLDLGFALLLVVCLLSCAAKPGGASFAPVYVTNRAKYVLLPPSALEAPLDMAQQIAGSWGKEEFLMDAWVRAGPGEIALVLFNSLGATLGDLSFSDEALSFSSSFFPSSLKAEYIVADFQFCFYRIDALVPALKGLTLEVELQDGPSFTREIRRILEGKKLIIEIEKTRDMVRYTNHLRGYAYTLRGAF